MNELIFNVKGMTCSGCSNRIENVLKEIDGVLSVSADHNDGSVKVELNKDISFDILTEEIENLGFEVISNS